MNDILQLKGAFQQRSNPSRGGSPQMPNNSSVKSEHLGELLQSLKRLGEYWLQQKIINGALLDTYYTRVIAKSNRMSDIFLKSKKSANNSVVGARFLIDEHENRKHIITYYINNETINYMVEKLEICIGILNNKFNGSIDGEKLKKLKSDGTKSDSDGISLSAFRHIIVDSSYIEKFDIPDNRDNTKNQSIITIYKTDINTREVLKKIGIEVPAEYIMDGTTILLRPDQIMVLREKVPYLIAMAVENKSKQSYNEIIESPTSETNLTITPPGNEPIIGVIDTMFDEGVYFSEWVEFRKMIDDEIPFDQNDYNHGTAVSSIIVDGPAINPDFDDGCGRFRVRHFGVATKGQYSAFEIMKSIKTIVKTNPDIRVWNLSLGSDNEVNLNSISPEAAILDEIQYEQDVIFVIAGTNKRDVSTEKRIGSPADSINSIVVNSVNHKDQPASYSRKGLVLSFFNKPDVSSYGGDQSINDSMWAYTPKGKSRHMGTSFAAPWVTRKVAYLIEILGLSREVSKALIVDAATNWDDTGNDLGLSPLVGHGVVPISIEEVIKSRDDEIKFVISDISEKYDTYTYNLPVPIYSGKYPFVAKATLCYFPKCSINQGVDYTNTEMDIYLGRIMHKKNSNQPRIKSIDKNSQSNDGGKKNYTYEREARDWYRKWDNTKHIRESYGNKIMPRKVYENSNSMWGISLKTKERLIRRDGDGIKFGVVITLKEIDGVNRIDDFIRQCLFRGWLVNSVDVESRVEIYNKIQEDIKFDT